MVAVLTRGLLDGGLLLLPDLSADTEATTRTSHKTNIRLPPAAWISMLVPNIWSAEGRGFAGNEGRPKIWGEPANGKTTKARRTSHPQLLQYSRKQKKFEPKFVDGSRYLRKVGRFTPRLDSLKGHCRGRHRT